MTICSNCVHRKRGSDFCRHDRCNAPAVITKRIAGDYVYGFSDVYDRPHCSDINTDGKCPHFERKVGFFARLFGRAS